MGWSAAASRGQTAIVAVPRAPSRAVPLQRAASAAAAVVTRGVSSCRFDLHQIEFSTPMQSPVAASTSSPTPPRGPLIRRLRLAPPSGRQADRIPNS
ncbi:hypothetical protein RGE_24240 [Rubrivivax gelatinosus IL144]|uniref:Uncharacterized protein n=1 Tax=Rubrivivax gelatinosus (strain NBRC 100245 / IL144) TaxID=983917 RepID=I0HRX8_RUBGI|nr:hypothetical protein RGE_24240 [Rubrivivax gelatinosus IL144]